MLRCPARVRRFMGCSRRAAAGESGWRSWERRDSVGGDSDFEAAAVLEEVAGAEFWVRVKLRSLLLEPEPRSDFKANHWAVD